MAYVKTEIIFVRRAAYGEQGTALIITSNICGILLNGSNFCAARSVWIAGHRVNNYF